MTRVPYNRHSQIEKLRTGRQKAIIIGGVPIPADGADLEVVVPGDEVASEPPLMRALPRTRFAGSFGTELVLPERRAVCLEDFEQGLRLAGLMSDSEMLCEVAASGRKFRVKEIEAVKSVRHGSDPSELVARSERATHSAVVNEAQSAGMLSPTEKLAYYRRSRGRRPLT